MVQGSGRTELARVLFGLDRSDGGSVRIEGREVHLDSPATAIRLGLGRCPEDRKAEGYVKALGIKTADVDTPIGQLSGGNQQKAVLARWLATQPQLLILDEPTRGIDIAAKQEIMNEILSLAQQGMAVLFISSEMDEVVRVSDRIVVLRNRAKVGELRVVRTNRRCTS